MAFQIVTALRSLAPIVASATGLGSWLVNRNQDKSRNTEVRLTEIETGLQEHSNTLVQLAEQVQIMVIQMEEKDRQIVDLRRKSIVSWIALVVAGIALIAALCLH